jgi:hypothetical protein
MRRAVLLTVCLAFAPAAPAFAQTSVAAELPAGIAARGRDSELGFAEFDRLMLARHGEGETGRAALKHLLNARVLDALAKEAKLVLGEHDVQKRLDQIEKDIAASGEKGGLSAYLKSNGISLATFKEFLRLGIIQETLARRALGIPEGKPVSGESQELWLDQVMGARGVDYPAPPWPDGVAARCGDVSVTVDAFAAHLRLQVDRATLREDCFQALLQKRRARPPARPGPRRRWPARGRGRARATAQAEHAAGPEAIAGSPTSRSWAPRACRPPT